MRTRLIGITQLAVLAVWSCVVVGLDIEWFITSYDDLTVSKGETVRFQWTGRHNVLEVSANSCSASVVQVIANTSPGGVANATNLAEGDHFFICTVANHCENGMKVKVTVSSPDDDIIDDTNDNTPNDNPTEDDNTPDDNGDGSIMGLPSGVLAGFSLMLLILL
eukprot:Clim_evm51s203 gene=Clim_evmTU51s203